MKTENEANISQAQLREAIRAIVPEVLAEMLGVRQNLPVAHNREWYSAEDAAQLLDLNRPEKLHKMRRNGLFREGQHCRTTNDSATAKIPRWQYHVGRCREVLDRDTAKRPSPRRTT
jgi:hypothetical protein